MKPAALQFLQSFPLKISATQAMKSPTYLAPNSIPYTNKFSVCFLNSSSVYSRFTSMPRFLLVRCSSKEINNEGLKDAISGMVDKRVEQLLNREENKVLLDGLEEASRRVEMAKKELADIERQEIEAAQLRDYVVQLENRASEIAECQREISEAQAMVEEAENSLSADDVNGIKSIGNEETFKEEERWESIKAASVSAVIGTLAGLPISLSQVSTNFQLILPVAITFVSCALFGVTFRYTIRRDLDNIQLKTGTSAAFGFVKGLAALGAGPPLELDVGSFLSHAVDGAVCISENLLIFVFASIGLDYCFKMKLLSPFPIQKSISQNNTR
ncbi:uncharacterized protein LOC122081372 [Macadamia integrifolia]|uniref:uncharacterized protein LOC122081372 n=1 Tax=Macadamia integrifolia TaxID=60698 RepID=UPI001C4F97BA|nr:uncharacterized protein LOC122081372 [Macadamia integrifolia]